MQGNINCFIFKDYPNIKLTRNRSPKLVQVSIDEELDIFQKEIIKTLEKTNKSSQMKYYDNKLENLYNDFYEFVLKQDLAEQIVQKDPSCMSRFSKDVMCLEKYKIDTKALPEYIRKVYDNLGYLNYEQTYELNNLSYNDLREKLYNDISKLKIKERNECIKEIDRLLQSDLSKDNLMSEDLKKVYIDVKMKLLNKVR